MRTLRILTFIFIFFIISSCAMVGSGVASAATGSSVNFGLIKAKNMMFYTPEKFPPHDKNAWKQYIGLSCAEFGPLLREKQRIFEDKKFKIQFNAKDENILEYWAASREVSDVRIAAKQNCEVGRYYVIEKDESTKS
tara:strand:- start:521 stop:931 length:411 start_codon:yes stop_codon:yes gene_type:complete